MKIRGDQDDRFQIAIINQMGYEEYKSLDGRFFEASIEVEEDVYSDVGATYPALNMGDSAKPVNELFKRLGRGLVDLLSDLHIRDIRSIVDRLSKDQVRKIKDKDLRGVGRWFQCEGYSDEAFEFFKEYAQFATVIGRVAEGGRDPKTYLAGLNKAELRKLQGFLTPKPDPDGYGDLDPLPYLPLIIPPEHIKALLSFEEFYARKIVDGCTPGGNDYSEVEVSKLAHFRSIIEGGRIIIDAGMSFGQSCLYIINSRYTESELEEARSFIEGKIEKSPEYEKFNLEDLFKQFQRKKV